MKPEHRLQYAAQAYAHARAYAFGTGPIGGSTDRRATPVLRRAAMRLFDEAKAYAESLSDRETVGSDVSYSVGSLQHIEDLLTALEAEPDGEFLRRVARRLFETTEPFLDCEPDDPCFRPDCQNCSSFPSGTGG